MKGVQIFVYLILIYRIIMEISERGKINLLSGMYGEMAIRI